MVNESGASIYSASEAAREEFPDLDVTVRGGVSIGRRLMDPLSELVKIDPKSIGVGQYQHDVDPAALKQSLDDVVVSCVNAVGVDVNRPARNCSPTSPASDRQSPETSWRSGIRERPVCLPQATPEGSPPGPQGLRAGRRIPENHEAGKPPGRQRRSPGKLPHRDRHGRGPGLHGRRSDQGKTAAEKRFDPKNTSPTRVGLPTLTDILAELDKPGRDPRQQFEIFEFAEGVDSLADLLPGMHLPGIVTNVTAFGAFVDVGVHQDGLVHISELADRFVKDPAEVVKVRQPVTVTVLSVDSERKRIALSMKRPAGGSAARGKAIRPQAKRLAGRPKPPGPGRPKGKDTPFNNAFADLAKLKVGRKEDRGKRK